MHEHERPARPDQPQVTTPDVGPAAAVPAETCDWCGSTQLWWRNCKLLCRNCGGIVKSCGDL